MQDDGEMPGTLESLFTSYPSAQDPCLVQPPVPLRMWHIPLKPLVFPFCAILHLTVYESEREILFLPVRLTMLWILQFESSDKSK